MQSARKGLLEKYSIISDHQHLVYLALFILLLWKLSLGFSVLKVYIFKCLDILIFVELCGGTLFDLLSSFHTRADNTAQNRRLLTEKTFFSNGQVYGV